MEHKYVLQRYRQMYASLLRLYSKQYYERYGEGMEQTFNDLLGEQLKKNQRLLGLALWLFIETFKNIIKEKLNIITMKNKRLIFILLVIAGLLSVPAIAMQFTEQVDWDATDFIVMGALLLIVGLGIEFVMRKVRKPMHRAAIVLAILFAFLLLWAELAVGVFNSPIAGS